MEEDPKEHDFDQRRDGPLQRPSVQIDTDNLRRTVSDDNAGHKNNKSQSTPHAAVPMSAFPSSGRRGTQPQADEQPPRRSTQINRSGTWGRQSRDWDTRRDGPFGRPSLSMARRRSSGLSMGQTSPTGTSPPVLPLASEDIVSSPVGETNEKREDGEGTAPSDTVPPSVETLQSSDAAFEPEPPPLNYTLWTRKFPIFWFWSLILIDSIAMPLVLYFCLWYLAGPGYDPPGDKKVGPLSANTVFSIVTAALGGASIIEYFLRFWRLWKKGSTCRVIGARRMYLDWFHWNFSFAWIIVMVELIVGSIPEHPPIRLLAMPLATMTYTFGTEMMIIDIARYFKVPAPCRLSSIPKGAQLRPGIYTLIEDVCAVDGSGGTEFRENLNKRYEASHMFRSMMRRVGIFWAVGAQATATLTTILIFTLSDDAAYVVGWSLPFVWAGIWTPITIFYVQYSLKKELVAWTEEVARKSNA